MSGKARARKTERPPSHEQSSDPAITLPRARGVGRDPGICCSKRSDAARAWDRFPFSPANRHFSDPAEPDVVRRPFYTLLTVFKEICELDEIGVSSAQ